MVKETIFSDGARKTSPRRATEAGSEESAFTPSATAASTSREVVPSGFISTLSVSES